MRADADNSPRLTVGSLLGMRLGEVLPSREAASAPSSQPSAPSGSDAEENEGPNWTVTGGVVSRGRPVTWRADGVEALTFNNPFGQVMERVWFDGKIVYALDCGPVEVDPHKVQVAQEYQIVYEATLDDAGKPTRDPEVVPGQYNIYDSVPGMAKYSPIWQFNYVVVPRDYRPNTLRSESDCLASGYPVRRSTVFEN
jgi:hypothetical protein